jgi:putative transcriptional regulator
MAKTDKDGLPIIDMSDTTELGQSIIQGLKEAVLYKRGKLTEADGVKVYHYNNSEDEIDVKSIRSNLDLTQEEFAIFIDSSVRAVQHWEQKTRNPDGPTRVLLELISRNPKMVWDTMHNSHT